MNKLLKTTFVFILSGLFGLAIVQAETRPLVEGTDYEVMAPKGAKTAEVLEFFSYACAHCYTMETFVNRFKKENSGIKMIPVPTDLGHPQWQIYVKAYYLGEMLKVLDKSHSKIFHRINVEHKHITKEADLKAFFVGLGVDAAKYDKAYESFTLSSKIRKAKQQASRYRISSTPAFVANQRYKLNNPALGTTEMIEKALKDLTAVSL